jgi:hypothetical protein
MRIRDKYITAACRSIDGIEWTCLKVKPDGTEPVLQDAMAIPISGDTAEEALASIELPEAVIDNLMGDITVPLRTSELLLRVMEFPTAEENEIADMVGFQIDKISPFPVDQLALSHEVLRRSDDQSLVLMAAAKRSCIDAIGDTFEQKGVRTHSIDARVLGWMKLIQDEGHVANENCELFIIDDGIDFSLVVVCAGLPMAFRMLHAPTDESDAVDELAYEIGYTLTTLDTEHDLPPLSAIRFWDFGQHSDRLRDALAEKTGIAVHPHQLASLPPLSEGIVRRALAEGSRIELIPREWIEHESRQQLRKKFTIIASAVAAVWLAVLLVFYSIYKVRDVQLGNVRERALAIEPAAKEALQNRQKLKALRAYTDRSDSSLECLRECTLKLPVGDIEFVSYNYRKNKGVTLRGTANNDNIVYDYFEALTTSPLFEQLKDQSVNTQTKKGVRRAVFSVTLVLASGEESK